MPVFQITPTEDAELLERIVSASFAPKDRFILSGMQACFVRFKGTMEDLTRLSTSTGKRRASPVPP